MSCISSDQRLSIVSGPAGIRNATSTTDASSAPPQGGGPAGVGEELLPSLEQPRPQRHWLYAARRLTKHPAERAFGVRPACGGSTHRPR